MQQQGTSTIVTYERHGNIVTPIVVQRSWFRGQFIETARWRVSFAQVFASSHEMFCRMPPAPLGYGRAELLAGGFIKPSLYALDGLPFLALR